MSRPMSFWQSVWRDQHGVSVVEMAVCCPFLVLLLTGLIDLGQGLADRLMIQKAANLGLEIVQASPPQIEAGDADYDYQHVRREAAAAAKVPIRNVRMSRWLECNGVRQPIDAICLVGQRSARFLSIEIRKIYQPQFVPKTYNLVVSAAVRIQ
jgi:hypothetical protein